MFNFKKTKREPDFQIPGFGIEVAAPEPTIEEQIHNDVYSAQELLLAEAKAQLNIGEPFDGEAESRYEKLIELGFSRALPVSGYTQTVAEKKRHAETVKRIEYYSEKYPLNKFINEDAVKKICGKYGLLRASVYDYISDIPVKNQNEIIAFKVRCGDTPGWLSVSSHSYFYDKDTPEWRVKQMHERMQEEFADRKARENDMESGKELQIIAPVEKLDTHNREIKGYRLEIKDPIVLQPVNGGYLIVTSWGLEASDELVMNPKHN